MKNLHILMETLAFGLRPRNETNHPSSSCFIYTLITYNILLIKPNQKIIEVSNLSVIEQSALGEELPYKLRYSIY